MMSYHAFLFDYNAFASELKPLIEECLRTGATQPLEHFVEQNRRALVSIKTGEPLPEDWRPEVEGGSVTEYADLALTKYYDETDNLVMSRWRRIAEAFTRIGGRQEIALGGTVGSADRLFDPTGQGSYFQSPDQVRQHLKIVNGWLEVEESVPEELMELRDMFQSALDAGKGLYVKFI